MPNNSTYWQDVQNAKLKWPECKSRPQDTYRFFLDYQRTNNLNPDYPAININREEIENWNPPEKLLHESRIYTELDLNRKAIYVRTKERLKWMVRELRYATEFAIDIEWDEQNSFLHSISLIQIATTKDTFLLDPYPLHQHLARFLKPILENPRILKVFHDHRNDILRLQSCLKIYSVGVLDTQAIDYYLQRRLHPMSFENTAIFYLGLNISEHIDKSVRYADFRYRIPPPEAEHSLPKDLEKYGAMDAHLLLRMWNQQKIEIIKYADGEGISADSVIMSIYSSMLRTLLATFTNSDFHRYIQRNYSVKSRDIESLTNEESTLFSKINEWRVEIAKYYDCTPAQVLSTKQMTIIAKNTPTTPKDLLYHLGEIPAYIRRYGIEKFITDILEHSLQEFDMKVSITNGNQRKIRILEPRIPKITNRYSYNFRLFLPCYWCRKPGHRRQHCINSKNEFREQFRNDHTKWKREKDRCYYKRKIEFYKKFSRARQTGIPVKYRLKKLVYRKHRIFPTSF